MALQTENQKWETTWNGINQDRFFDFTKIKQEGEMKWQLATVVSYLTASTNYLAYMTNELERMKETLKPLYPDNKLAQGAVKGAKQKFDQQRPIMVPLFKRHISYGSKMYEIVKDEEAINKLSTLLLKTM